VESRYIVYWLSIYFGISSSSLLHVALVDPVVHFRRATLVDPVMGTSSPEITTQRYIIIVVYSTGSMFRYV